MVVRTEGACRLVHDAVGEGGAAFAGGKQRDREMNEAGGGRIRVSCGDAGLSS
jgi:hypothetical protein